MRYSHRLLGLVAALLAAGFSAPGGGDLAARAHAEEAPIPACPASPGWIQLTGNLPSPFVARDVAGDWTSGDAIYLAGEQGLFRTDDCGATWMDVPVPPPVPFPYRIEQTAIYGFAVGPGGALYIGAYNTPITVSPDRGQTWLPAPSVPGGSLRSLAIAASPSSPGVAYAISHRVQGRGAVGLFRTLDGGQTWESRDGYSSGKIAVDALNPDVVYIGDTRCRRSTFPPCQPYGILIRSDDAGQSFGTPADFDAPVTALGMSIDGSRFWLATRDGRLYRSLDGGRSWVSQRDTGFAGYLVSISASPFDPRVFFAVNNTGLLWAYREPLPGEVAAPRACPFTATLGFERVWRTGTLPRGAIGCPTEEERPVRIRALPLGNGIAYQPADDPEFWMVQFDDGSDGRLPSDVIEVLARPGFGPERSFDGAIQRFEAATMLWVQKPDGSRAILVFQDDLWREFPD